jgi:ankyrin repeat protein
MKASGFFLWITTMALSGAATFAHADELFDAINASDAVALKAAIAAGTDVNRAGLSGSALHLAVGIGDLEIVEALIAAGANLEVAGDPSDAHPLHIAAQVDESEIAGALIDHGAKVDALDGKGRTPLMVAVVNGSSNAAALLLSRGADPKAEDALYHDAPIRLAVWANKPEMLKLLVSAGADVNQANPINGWTPLHYAANDDRGAAIEFLMANGADSGLRDASGKTPLQLAHSAETVALLRKLGAAE